MVKTKTHGIITRSEDGYPHRAPFEGTRDEALAFQQGYSAAGGSATVCALEHIDFAVNRMREFWLDGDSVEHRAV